MPRGRVLNCLGPGLVVYVESPQSTQVPRLRLTPDAWRINETPRLSTAAHAISVTSRQTPTGPIGSVRLDEASG